jgi:hypothetical protein
MSDSPLAKWSDQDFEITENEEMPLAKISKEALRLYVREFKGYFPKTSENISSVVLSPGALDTLILIRKLYRKGLSKQEIRLELNRRYVKNSLV